MDKLRKSFAIILAIITIFTVFSVAMPVFAAEYAQKQAINELDLHEEFTSRIISEVTELRDEHEKHFLCEDGSYIVASYEEPVHYKENGEWKEIDNTLHLNSDVKSSSDKAMYTTKSGVVDVKIPQSFSEGQKVSASNKGYTINFGANHDKLILNKKPTAQVKDIEVLSSSKIAANSTASANEKSEINDKKQITAFNNDAMSIKNQAGAVVYEDVFGKADLEYIVTTDSIKENIIVTEKQDQYIFSFDMDFGELVPIVNEDNSISIVKPDTEEIIFYIEAPYMYDAAMNESTDIEVTLIKNRDSYTLKLEADASWINKNGREFPVVIDPTVYLTFDDVFVMNGAGYQNSTKINKELRVGRNLSNLTRTYIKPTIPTNIPAGSYINNAYLKLIKDNYYQAPSASNISIRVYDCYDVNLWSSTNITWANQPYNNSNNGYASGHTYLSDILASSNTTTYSFNVTDAVKRWLNGGVNNGLMLASSNEATKTQIDFHSSRASDSNNRPQLYIVYTAPKLSVSSWDTGSQENELAFNITSGSAWTAETDVNWITLEATSGNAGNDVANKVFVDENPSIEDRVGHVTVKFNNTIIGTINITQYGADSFIELDASDLRFDAGATVQTINISSDTVWTFGDLPDWVNVTPSTGSNNGSVEIEVLSNYSSATRECTLTVSTDATNRSINIFQDYDSIAPSSPILYEEDDLVYISANSLNFNETTDSPEHVEYKLGNGEWTNYDDEPLSIIRSYDVTIYARTCDAAGNISEITSLVLDCDLGEYTASYTDIVLGEGVLPVGFERTYSSEDGWFFTFEANIAEYTNGYVFTDFYGNKQYYILNNEGKYISAYGEELKVTEGTLLGINYSYYVPYGKLDCYFNSNGKLAIVKDNYNTATYSWSDNNVCITDEANKENIVSFSNGKPVYISVLRLDSETNTILSKNVQYQWTNGNLTKFIDVANVEHNYAYTNGLLTTNEDENIVYSTDGRVKKISQPNGAFVKYTYNDSAASANEETPNNIGAVTVTDSKGVSDIWYYADGFSISNGLYSYSDRAAYDPTNISSAITADNLSQVAYIISAPADEIVEENYKEYPLYEEDSNGNFTFYSYDSENNVTAILFVKSGTLSVTETTTFEQAQEIAEQKVDYSYDTNGNVTSEIYKKRVNNSLINQEKTVYTYNNKESILSKIDYQWLNGTWYQTYGESYTYNGYGNVTSKVITTYTNTENSETGIIEVSSNTTTTSNEYDAWCQLIKVTTNSGQEDTAISETAYDIFGRTISATSNGKTSTYMYDSRGNVITVTEDGETTTYSYANNGNLLSRTNSTGSIAGYTYDSYGNLTGHTFNGYAFTYNTLGSILTANAESGQLVNYTYSNTVNQEVLTSNFGNGQSIVYTYNADGEIAEIKLGTETKYGYEYFETTDENGEITKEWAELTDYVNNFKKTIEENKLTVKSINGQFIYSVENIQKDVNGTFNGKIENIEYSIYKTEYLENRDEFDGEFSGLTRNFCNNDDGSRSSVSYDFGPRKAFLSSHYEYNSDKLISVLENTLYDISKVFGYTYDSSGNILTETVTTKDEYGNVVGSETISYTYDDKEQLVSAETSTIKYEYTYDDRGNILNKREYAISLDENQQKVYTLIDANTDTYVYDTVWKDKLISYNGQTITYDAVGNPTNYMGNTLTWTMGRQLASFGNNTYTYDENGIRTSKTVNGVTTKYYLDGTRLIELTDGNDTLHFNYDREGEAIGFTHYFLSTGVDDPVMIEYVYVKNAMGDVIGITNPLGSMLVSYEYDPWGKLISVESNFGPYDRDISLLNPLRYRGYIYDDETGLYYLQSRYYDPEIGRFINSDDVHYLGITETDISYNTFAYCGNNPINDIDPTGYVSLNDIGDVFKKMFNAIKIKISDFIKGYLGYIRNGYLYISNSVISNVIDTMIYASSNAVVAAVKTASFKTLCSAIKTYAKNNYAKVATYLEKKLFGKVLNRIIPDVFEFTFKNIAKIWGKKVIKFFAANVIIDRLTKNFTVYNIISNFSSVGSIIAFVFDIVDGNPNGYTKLKVK